MLKHLLLFGILIPTFLHGNIDSLISASNESYSRGDYPAAFHALQIAESKAITAGNTSKVIEIGLKIADVNRATQHYLKALEILDEVDVLLGSMNDAQAKASSLILRSSIYYETSNHDLSSKFALQALRIAQKEQLLQIQGQVFNLIGSMKKAQEPDSAIWYQQKAIDVFEALNDSSSLTLAFVNMAHVQARIEAYEIAEDYALMALEMSKNLAIPIYSQMAYNVLIPCYKSKNDIEGTFWALDKRDSISNEIRNNKREMLMQQLAKDYEIEKKRVEREKSQLYEIIEKSRSSILWSAVAIIFLLSLTVFLMWRQGRERKRNLTDLERLNQEIQAYADKLEDSNLTKDRILSVISHDLRAPFAHLLTYLSFGDEGLSEADKKLVQKELATNTQNGLFMLDNLLHWANAQAREGMHLDIKLFNLKLSVKNLIDQIEDTVNTKGIELKNACQNINVTTDEVILQIILRNLLSNAIKFSHIGSKINVISSHFENQLTIEVIDRGVGIPEDILSRLNTSSGVLRPGEGTEGERGAGLGLKLSMEFAKMLNGGLSFEINQHGGTTAKLTLPINPKEA